MTNHISLTFAIILLLCACKNENLIRPIANDNADSLKDTRLFAKKPANYHYTFDSARSNFENVKEGYMDTFSINGSRFQFFLNPNYLEEFELQVLKNGLWANNLNVGYAVYGSNAKYDVNEDGLKDFVCSLLHGNEAYIFNDTVKQFCKEPIYIAHDWSVIDSARNLYSNNYSYGDYWQTDLFVLKDLKQKFLYNAIIDLHIDSMAEPANVRLYKLINGKKGDTTLVSHSKFDNLNDKFDYKEYWRKFAKRNID